MADNPETAGFGTTALSNLKAILEIKAQSCGFEIRLIGGLLKFTPKGVYSKVFLELEQPEFRPYAVIYNHRTHELTQMHKGKRVTKDWISRFLEYNSKEANDEIEKKGSLDPKKSQTPVNSIDRSPRKLVARTRCPECQGMGSWQAGDPRDGDSRFEYCSVCRGVGHIDA